MTGHAIRPGKLPEQPLQSVSVALDRRISLGIRAFQVGLRHQPRPAMARPGDENHVQIVLFDQPVQMDVKEVQAGRRSPMPEQARLDMLERERGFEQGIVLQVDLADRQVVRSSPIRMHLLKEGGRQGIRHHVFSEIDRNIIALLGGRRIGWLTVGRGVNQVPTTAPQFIERHRPIPPTWLLPEAVSECAIFRFDSSLVWGRPHIMTASGVSMPISPDELWRLGSLLALPGIGYLVLLPCVSHVRQAWGYSDERAAGPRLPVRR